jgi:PAS domain S-box-containing protein
VEASLSYLRDKEHKPDAILAITRDITERKRAEEAVKEKSAELDRFFGLTLDLLCVADIDGHLRRVNLSWRRMLGYRQGELEGTKFLDMVHPEDIPATLQAVADLASGKEVIDFVNRYRCRDGSYRWLEWRSASYKGKLIYAAARDITERHRVEEALRDSEERYRHVVELSPELIGVHREGKYVYMNPAGAKLFGAKGPEELIGRSIFDFVHPDFLGIARNRVEEIYQEGKVQPMIEEKFLCLDGKVVDVEVAVAALNYQKGPAGLVIARDITERKRAEEALRKSEEEAKRLAQETTIMAEIGKIISATLNIEEVYERFVAEVRKLFPFDRLSINLKEEDKVKVAYISGLDVPTRRAGEPYPLAGAFVSEVMRTRSSLVVNPESMKKVIARFPGFLPTYQAGLRAVIGVPLFSRDELIGVMSLSSSGHFSYTERDRRLAESVGNQISGAIANALIFTKLKRAEEDLRMAQMVLETRVQERTAELVKMNQDLQTEIIERKHAEESLKIAKEGAEAASIAKSSFLANMSHEVRTPLNAIIGFSELMADGQAGELNETQKEYLTDVLQSGHHLLSLINDILDLSKMEAGKMELELEDVSLQALLQGSLVMVKEKALKHRVEISGELNGIPDPIMADKRKMKQVLSNLLSNAVKFTPDGGRVVIRGNLITKRRGSWVKEDDGSLDCPIPVDFENADRRSWALVSIEDTGIGIEKRNLERIFAPFEQADITASRRFQGTGLGLALTRQFVELHGGKVWAESQGLGKGSAFRFLMPISRVEEERAQP